MSTTAAIDHHVSALLDRLDPMALLPARDAIASALSEMGWEQDEAMRVLVAAVEGIVNAVEHGSTAGGRVTVRCAIGAEYAELSVVDEGRPGARPPRLDPDVPSTTPPAAAV